MLHADKMDFCAHETRTGLWDGRFRRAQDRNDEPERLCGWSQVCSWPGLPGHLDLKVLRGASLMG